MTSGEEWTEKYGNEKFLMDTTLRTCMTILNANENGLKMIGQREGERKFLSRGEFFNGIILINCKEKKPNQKKNELSGSNSLYKSLSRSVYRLGNEFILAGNSGGSIES